jgi:hypothetical protein
MQKHQLVNDIVATVQLPEWHPKSTKKIETDEKVKKQEAEKEASTETAEEEFKKLLAEVSAFVHSGGKLSLEPADFEKVTYFLSCFFFLIADRRMMKATSTSTSSPHAPTCALVCTASPSTSASR